MKGKGKGDRSSNRSAGHSHDEKDALQFPDFKPVDHVRQCPRFSAGMVCIIKLHVYFTQAMIGNKDQERNSL